MSFLTGKTESVKAAVISLWFRVPSKTIDAITKEYKEWIADGTGMSRRRFLGVVPLMTFGPTSLKARKYYFSERVVGEIPAPEFWNWTDGSGSPACVGAGWQITSGEGGSVSDSYWTFDPGGSPAGGGFELDGSYIGVDCTGDGPALSVSLVMPADNKATFKGAWPVVKSKEQDGPTINYGGGGICPGAPGTHVAPPDLTGNPAWQGDPLCLDTQYSSIVRTTTYESNADVVAGCVPETFRLLPAVSTQATSATVDQGTDQNYKGASISPDHWHHLLLSFDLTQVSAKGQHLIDDRPGGVVTPVDPVVGKEGARTGSTIKIWVALDDKNLTKKQLSVYWPDGYGDPNGILSVNGMMVAKAVTSSLTETDHPAALCAGYHETTISTQELPTYSYTPAALDLSNLGLPASSADAVRNVEMAELQIFAGVTVNTGDTTVRRAFVGKDGKPVSPTQKEETDPVTKQVTKDSGSIDLLGKWPEILLHGSANWKKGISTGQPDPRRPGKKDNSQEFTPTGGIETYKPDPSLSGDQGDQGKPKAP